MIQNNKPRGRKRGRFNQGPAAQNIDKIQLEGKIVETYPGAQFGVEVSRKNDLPPIFIKADLKTSLKMGAGKRKKVTIIKGDVVVVELSPENMTTEEKFIKGTIIQRLSKPNNFPPRPNGSQGSHQNSHNQANNSNNPSPSNPDLTSSST